MLTFGQHVLPAWVLGPFLALLWAAWAARGGARMGAGRPGAARAPRRVPLLCWLEEGLGVWGPRRAKNFVVSPDFVLTCHRFIERAITLGCHSMRSARLSGIAS